MWLFCSGTPSTEKRLALPLPPTSFNCLEQERPPLVPTLPFSSEVVSKSFKAHGCFKGVLHVTMRK